MRDSRAPRPGGHPDRERRAPAAPFGTDPVGVQAMLAAIVASSDDAIVSKDLNGTIMSWNVGAERLFGYTAEEAIGRPITMLLPPERQSEEAAILATLVRGERVDHFKTERLTKDGRRIHVSLSVSPIKNAEGRVVGGAKIARDITLRRQLEAEREQLLVKEREARQVAERANRAKDAFLAMISHELRSPLSPILAWARMLRRGGSTRRRRGERSRRSSATRSRRRSSSTICSTSHASSPASSGSRCAPSTSPR